MNHLQQQYAELIALTQLFLLREFSLKEQKTTDQPTFSFFQKWTSQARIVSNTHTQAQKPKQEEISFTPPPSDLPTPIIPNPVHLTSFPPPTTYSQISQTKPLIETPKPIKLEIHPEPIIPKVKSPNPIQKAVKSEQSFIIDLEPISNSAPIDCQEFKKIMKEHFPHYPLIDQIPSDQTAKKIKKSWDTESILASILILSFNEQERHLHFLKNMAQAITLHLAPAQVLPSAKIEQENKWAQVLKTPHLRLIIASDYHLYLLPELMKHYKEVPRQAKHFLNEIPLLLLSDLSLYLKEPQLKPLLWRAICTEFEASKISQPAKLK